jgi:hypothetical protein
MRRLLALSFIIGAACASSTAPRGDDLVGEWLKEDKSLPPINLTVTRSGADLRARLRLSGTERSGSLFVNGTHLLVTLDGTPEPLTGELVSTLDLDLRLTATGQPYRLRKQ